MNVKPRYLLIVLALVRLNFAAASATVARPEWVKPPTFATDDVDAGCRNRLLVVWCRAVETMTGIQFADHCLGYRALCGDDFRSWVNEPHGFQVNGEPFELNPAET